MAPTLLPAGGRVRTRTSDISDFLRGRHDAKTSIDLPPPPVPRLPIPSDPVTPPKGRSKFAFLGRKKKLGSSPSSAKADAPVIVSPSGGLRRDHDSKGSHLPVMTTDGNQPAAGSSLPRPSHQRGQSGPQTHSPLSGIPIPQSGPSRLAAATPTQSSHSAQYGPARNVVNNLRRQKTSVESARRSTDSRASTRPIITVSPPHNNLHEVADAYTAPRSVPQPPGLTSPQRSESALPTPVASDRTATPDSPTSVDIPSPAASIIGQPPSPTDGPTPTASSYKEEILLRRDHFEVRSSDPQSRRGTVSSLANQPAPATVGYSLGSTRQDRRHVSVIQLSKLKREIVATAPKVVRKVSSDLTSKAGQGLASPLGRSRTISTTPPHTPSGSGIPQSGPPTPQGRRVPPPLKRTWHTPPSTGPPKEPLPSPPASAARVVQATLTTDTVPSSPASPLSPRRALPPLVPPKDVPSSSRAQGAKSPDSLSSVPPSPAGSSVSIAASLSTDLDTRPSSPQPPQTPVREDPARRVLANADASAEELRAALQTQAEKYKRLSAYLLSLTERHALERAELMRKVELLEQDKARREREMKGLKWLVVQAAREKEKEPARMDSGVLPAMRTSNASAKGRPVLPRDRSGSAATAGSGMTVTSMGSVGSPLGSEGRMSFDSPAGSVEEGLVELQTSISEFLGPFQSASEQSPPSGWECGLPAPAATTGVAPSGVRNRLRRSNTVPNEVSGVPQIVLQGKAQGPVPTQTPSSTASREHMQTQVQKVKMARRTSSPVIPSTISPATSASPPSLLAKRPSVIPSPSAHPSRTGVGLGIEASPALTTFSRSPSPDSRADPHARSDSSTLSSLPSLTSLSTTNSSSSVSGLSSIPETPRTDVALLDEDILGVDDEFFKRKGSVRTGANNEADGQRLSTSSASSSSAGSGGSSRVSVSPSIGQVLARTKAPNSNLPQYAHRQPEMDVIMKRLRAFGQGQSP